MKKWMLMVAAVTGLVSTSGASASVWGKGRSGEMNMSEVASQARQCARRDVSKGSGSASAAQSAGRKKSSSGVAIRLSSN